MPHHQIRWMTLLALTLMHHQKAEKAEALFEALVLFCPTRPELTVWLAEAQLAQAKSAEVLDTLKQLESDEVERPILAAATLLRAQAHWRGGQSDQAGKALHEFLKLRQELAHV